ncbi:Hypothetical predicted protein [Mytilus galloprovincialis]|uniref:PH domain-containing protein n=1 Tax=Mytilus galloprovincialis TaxID=29158 RepID=A0A8B6HFS5_MYTGA|nr:Hypothetical predicted protein [Mytilus galloprovincialis]
MDRSKKIVERDFEKEEKEQPWVIKIIPAADTNKSIYFALPSEKDLLMWTDRILHEIRVANDEGYQGSYINCEMVQSPVYRSGSESFVYDEVRHYDDRDDSRFLSSAYSQSTQSLPARFAHLKMSNQSACSFGILNTYEERRPLPAPPVPQRTKRKETNANRYCNTSKRKPLLHFKCKRKDREDRANDIQITDGKRFVEWFKQFDIGRNQLELYLRTSCLP